MRFVETATLAAQSFTGSILGVVADSSGAVVPNAVVNAVSKQTGERRTAQSTSVGQHTISALSPGGTISRWRRRVPQVSPRGTASGRIAERARGCGLQPGSVSDTITVKGDSSLLETANASVGQVIDNARIVDLPLNGRNSLALVALTGAGRLISPRLVARGGYGIFFYSTVGQGGLVGNGNDGFGARTGNDLGGRRHHASEPPRQPVSRRHAVAHRQPSAC
jgi:hypothetical protein